MTALCTVLSSSGLYRCVAGLLKMDTAFASVVSDLRRAMNVRQRDLKEQLETERREQIQDPNTQTSINREESNFASHFQNSCLDFSPSPTRHTQAMPDDRVGLRNVGSKTVVSVRYAPPKLASSEPLSLTSSCGGPGNQKEGITTGGDTPTEPLGEFDRRLINAKRKTRKTPMPSIDKIP